MKTLYLIDGYAQFFRAYHAIRTPMTSPVTKEPTNMTFGFVGMLLKLLRGEGQMGGRPDYIAVALDVSGDRGTFRSQIYRQYKATRDEPPDDLFPQVERALSLLREIGVPVIGAEGFEADDVIATIATTFSEKHPDIRVRIISKDKDLKQLLGEGDPPTEMYDVHTDTLITARTLREETGLEPRQVIDMLALMGDTTDNVPGVPGIGIKTAAQLIADFGSLDAVIEEVRADKPRKDWKIKGKRRENILAAADDGTLDLSHKLVVLRHDAPIDMDLSAADSGAFRLDALAPILRELGFNRYQEELRTLLGAAPGAGTSAPVPADGAPPEPTRSDEGRKHADGGLFDSVATAPGTPIAGDYTCVTTQSRLADLVAALRAAALIAVDTETTSLSPVRARLCGLSFAVEAGRAWYVPVRSPDPSSHLDEHTVLDALRPILEDPDRPKTGHNLKYDLLVLRGHGVELRGLSAPRIGDDGSRPPLGSRGADTMVASYLIDPSRSSHSLDALALAVLHRHNISIKDLIGTGRSQKTFDQVPLAQAAPYAAEDADVSLQLNHRLIPQIQAMGLADLWLDVEMPLVEVLAELEWNGILVDPRELTRQEQRLQARIDELAGVIRQAALAEPGREFNPDSPRQLAAILFNKPDDDRDGIEGGPGLGLRPGRRTKTGYSTDNEVLEKLDADPTVKSPIPGLILEYRQLTKLVGTYLKALRDEINPDTGRIHASFNQTVAATGRLSSSDPNLQNIPIRTDIGREIRKAFVAPSGCVLISADYSQIELRILAHLSGDPALRQAFLDDQDIHAAVAAQIHGVPLDQVTREQRNSAKMVNFGIVYGITPFGLSRRLGCSNTEAEGIIRSYKRRFAGITTFLEECIAQARRHGYVQTMLGRRRPITEIESNNQQRKALAERMAINSVVQGSAADLIKLAMVDLHRRFGGSAGGSALRADTEADESLEESVRRTDLPGVRMLLQIHDELVFESPDDVADQARDLIVDRMEHAMELSVPLKVDSSIARNWFEGK